MRCRICDKRLAHDELTIKDDNGEFRDTCSICTQVTNKTQLEDNSLFDPLGLKIPIDIIDEWE